MEHLLIVFCETNWCVKMSTGKWNLSWNTKCQICQYCQLYVITEKNILYVAERLSIQKLSKSLDWQTTDDVSLHVTPIRNFLWLDLLELVLQWYKNITSDWVMVYQCFNLLSNVTTQCVDVFIRCTWLWSAYQMFTDEADASQGGESLFKVLGSCVVVRKCWMNWRFI